MPAFEPTRRKAAALLFLGPAVAASPAIAAAPSSKKPAPRKPATPPERVPFSAAEQDLAAVPGFPDARFFGDSDIDFLAATQGAQGAWLALSGGGEDGAYGAGLLAGMTAAGKRPEFALITGASTGALMAPFVFLGPRYDETLRRNYTSIHAGDVFELAATPESLLDTWPLKELIEKNVTPQLLAEIAAEHRKGRRLFVVTTNLDAGRPVLWNLGAIAERAGNKALTEKAVALFRDVLLASSSIPAFFPPVHIAVEANGKKFREMHADGSIRAPFYVAPDGVLAGLGNARLAATQLYVLVNSKLATDFQLTGRSMTAVLGRSISVALKASLRNEILRVVTAAHRDRLELQLSVVPADFRFEARGAFDPYYMRALFDLGMHQAQGGRAFGNNLITALRGEGFTL